MAVPAGAVVMEVLDSSNYEDWNVLVKTYLLAQDLWDVVEEDEEEEADDKFKAWKKKNATALHKIQISCGREAFSLIRNTTSAKRAWDTLAEKFKPKPGSDDHDQCKPFFDAVWSGDWNKAKEFLTEHPNAIKARLPYTDRIALHFATVLEQEHIVEELVQLMSEDELEITDNWGQTALALAVLRGNLKMVKCMVGKSDKILSIPTGTSNRTPIILASMNELWDVVDYLYSVTPPQDLMPENGPYGAGLLRNFIIGMKFGRAWELIQRCPELVFTKGQNGKFPMEGFMPSAFLSGTRLKFWQRWIYNC